MESSRAVNRFAIGVIVASFVIPLGVSIYLHDFPFQDFDFSVFFSGAGIIFLIPFVFLAISVGYVITIGPLIWLLSRMDNSRRTKSRNS